MVVLRCSISHEKTKNNNNPILKMYPVLRKKTVWKFHVNVTLMSCCNLSDVWSGHWTHPPPPSPTSKLQQRQLCKSDCSVRRGNQTLSYDHHVRCLCKNRDIILYVGATLKMKLFLYIPWCQAHISPLKMKPWNNVSKLSPARLPSPRSIRNSGNLPKVRAVAWSIPKGEPLPPPPPL